MANDSLKYRIEPAHCPECGELARGTVEVVKGCAEFAYPDDDDMPSYFGETDIWWDEQKSVRDAEGRVTLVCPSGHDWQATMEDAHP